MSAAQVGVLALQGDVREHLAVLGSLGFDAFAVRRLAEVERCEGLVIPGGESTTIAKLARNFGLLDPIRQRVEAGMPTFGTCAGMILLADRIVDGVEGQETIGGLDILVRRNAFGRQTDSFESDLTVAGLADPVHGVFIRAPWVEETGPGVEVLARVAGHPVAVRGGAHRHLLATSFHPEVGGDARVHGLFAAMIG